MTPTPQRILLVKEEPTLCLVGPGQFRVTLPYLPGQFFSTRKRGNLGFEAFQLHQSEAAFEAGQEKQGRFQFE